MRREILAAWAKALKSGMYPQISGRLRDKDGFCALGVLCDVHSQLAGVGWSWDPIRGYSYLGSCGYPPTEVLDFIGLTPLQMRRIADLSDIGLPFRHLAQRIYPHL